jgi:hypothetical protein
MVTRPAGEPSTTPDHDTARAPGGTGKAKPISTSKGGSLPGNPKGTGAGQGRVRVGGNKGK